MNSYEQINTKARYDDLYNFFNVDRRNPDEPWLSLIKPQWGTIVIPGIILGTATSEPDLIPFGDPPTDLKVRAFDGNNIPEQLFASPKIVPDYKEKTDIIFAVEWSPSDNDSGNIKWFIDYTWANVDDIFSAQTTIYTIDPSDGVAWKHQEINFPAISGTGKKIRSSINFRLYRVPNDGQDTYGNDAALLNIIIHYKLNTFGSRLIDTK